MVTKQSPAALCYYLVAVVFKCLIWNCAPAAVCVQDFQSTRRRPQDTSRNHRIEITCEVASEDLASVTDQLEIM